MTSTADDSSSGSGTMTEEIKQGTQQLKQQAQQSAGQVTEQAKQQATSLASSQKTQAAENLNGISDALRSSGSQLESNGQTSAAQMMGVAADQVEKVSGYLESHSVQDMVSEAEAFARRQPAMFLGGAFALGFVLSRFLKSTPPQGTQTTRGSSSGYHATSSPYVREDVSGMPSGREYVGR